MSSRVIEGSGSSEERGRASSQGKQRESRHTSRSSKIHVEERSCGTNVVGTCQTWCPESEVIERIRCQCIHKLELSINMSPTPRELIHPGMVTAPIKEWQRSAAGAELAIPSLLRTPKALMGAAMHMLVQTAARDDCDHITICNFITNRLLSIRRDISIQNLYSSDCLSLIEISARFHIYLAEKMKDEPGFDASLNVVQIKNTLNLLDHIYKKQDVHESSKSFDDVKFGSSRAREQMKSCYCLYFMRPSDSNSHVSNIINAYHGNNYVRFFRLVSDLDSLEKIIISHKFEDVVSRALTTICISYTCGSRPMRVSLAYLSKIFDIEKKRLKDILELFGLIVDQDANVALVSRKCMIPKGSKWAKICRPSIDLPPLGSSNFVDLIVGKRTN